MLTVVNVAYPFAPVGPDAVGGAEQILSALDRALVDAGHRSIVVACEGSATAGMLLPVPNPARRQIDAAARNATYELMREAIGAAAKQADVIHLHGVDFHAYLPPEGKPAMVTLHLPVSWYPPEALRPSRRGTWFNCVSGAQHRTCPPDVDLLAPIPNGVPARALAAARHARRPYAIVLGRVCPEKGQHLALQAAHRADISLVLCGDVFPYPEHRSYFEKYVRPLLDSRRRFLGPVDFTRKRRLLAAARCLLLPSLCPETSSLTAMEALACGTPVIAFPAGALPEIVDHGRTGFLVDDVPQMAAAIGAADTIDRDTCRRVACDRFPVEHMTDAYLALYRRLATRVWPADGA